MPTQHRSPDRVQRLSAGWECRRSCQRNVNIDNDQLKYNIYYKEQLLVTILSICYNSIDFCLCVFIKSLYKYLNYFCIFFIALNVIYPI